LKKKVGAPGFEPGTFGSQNRRATKLRYAPIGSKGPIGRKCPLCVPYELLLTVLLGKLKGSLDVFGIGDVVAVENTSGLPAVHRHNNPFMDTGTDSNTSTGPS